MKYYFFFFLSLILVLLLFAVHYWQSINLVGLLFLGCAICLLQPLYILPVYIISCFSGDYFVMPGELGSVSRYIFIFISVALLLKTELRSFDKRSSYNLQYFIFVCLYLFFSSLLSKTQELETFLIFLQNLLILFLLSRYRNKNYLILPTLLNYGALIIFVCIVAEIYLIGLDIGSLASRFSVENVNENRLAMMFVQLGVLLFIPMFWTVNRLDKITLLITAPLILFLILVTGSRSALIAYIFSILIIYLVVYRRFTFSAVVIITILGLSGAYLFNYLSENIAFMSRFSIESAVETGGTGRLESLLATVKYVIPDNLFFGVGLGGNNTELALSNRGFVGYLQSHNILVDAFAQLGLVGFSLLVYFGYRFSKYFFIYKGVFSILYFPILGLLACIINGIGEVVFLEKFFWNNLALGSFFLYNFKRDNQLN